MTSHVSSAERCRLDLRDGWCVLQDVHDIGERLGIFAPEFAATTANGVSLWEEIPELGHLQLLLADEPYAGGRALRSFNDHAWWYRLEFTVEGPPPRFARLLFEGVDYFATVWLNGQCLGEHEGYFEPFGFDVAGRLVHGRANVLVVRVSSPWDTAVFPDTEAQRAFSVERALVKGTYEHMDGLIPRDVNPVGIWRPVTLELGYGDLWSHGFRADAVLSDDLAHGEVEVVWHVESRQAREGVRLRTTVRSSTGDAVVSESPVDLTPGRTALAAAVAVTHPQVWQPWDRGAPQRYDVVAELLDAQGVTLAVEERRIGFRTVSLERSAERTCLRVNGRPYYLRGTSYFPDLYLSSMDEGRYRRDVEAAVAAGMNCLRVHVHVEQPVFYEICDELGVLVVQDSDVNWVTPAGDEYVERAATVVGGMVRLLRHHPAVVAWVCVNEGGVVVEETRDVARRLAHHLVAVVAAEDPTRPTIANSWDADDPASGDEHVYAGSLTGGAYAEVRDARFRLLTEFGVDAPPARARGDVGRALDRTLRRAPERTAEHHSYAYHLTKFYIERCRLQRWQPNGGYVQFMWIDVSPQSWYGAYDYWGCPKVDGRGGAHRAFREVGQPMAVLLRAAPGGLEVWVVNDFAHGVPGATASWTVVRCDGTRDVGAVVVDIPPDGLVRAACLEQAPDGVAAVWLSLTSAGSDPLATNRYDDLVDHLPPEGYPGTVSHEIGARDMA
jgi:hypothetical protein